MSVTETPIRPAAPAQPYAEPAATTPAPRRSRRPWAIGLALLVVAAIAAAVVLIATGGKSDTLVLGQPRIVSSGELSSYAQSANHPVYWAGAAASGYKLELTEVRGQHVFVRYLTKNAKAGDPRAAFTTIGTYPMKGAAAQLHSFAIRPGAVAGTGAGGATTLYYKKRPSNVYVAQPGTDYLIEVYAPGLKGALKLAKSSLLTQVK